MKFLLIPILFIASQSNAAESLIGLGYENLHSTTSTDLAFEALSLRAGVKIESFGVFASATLSDQSNWLNSVAQLDQYGVEIMVYPIESTRLFSFGIGGGVAKLELGERLSWGRYFAPIIGLEVPLGRYISAGVLGRYSFHSFTQDTFSYTTQISLWI